MKRILFILSSLLIVFACDTAEKKQVGSVNSVESMNDSMLQGWNTWNNPSILSRVKMPEGLNLQMIFRKQRQSRWLEDVIIPAYRSRYEYNVIPVGHSYDGSYIDLELEWEGMKARITSATDGEDLVYLYTPVEKPDRPFVVMLKAGHLWNKPGCCVIRDSLIETESLVTGFKTTVGATEIPDGIKMPVNSPCLSFWSYHEVGFYTGEERTLEEIKTIIQEQKQQYESRVNSYGDLAETYRAMQSVNVWNIIYDARNDRAIVPVSRAWNSGWGGWVLFDWDTYFTGAMLAMDNKYLGYANCIAITSSITPGGFIPNFDSFFGARSDDRSQPPVGSLVCNMIYKKHQDEWFLEEVYDELLSWNRWWDKERNNDGYLSWGSTPVNGMGNTKQAAKFESGLDNSPLFDDAVYNSEKHMLELASVGLMGMYVGDCKNLAEIAEVLGKTDDVEELNNRAAKYSEKLQELWDEESGIYRDKYINTGELSDHLAPTNFYPLLGGVPSEEQARRMIDEHFMNPEEFYGTWMIPSIARNDPAFSDNSYWRGRIWAPMNFLVYMGLRNYDLPEARKILAGKSKKLILKEWLENGRVHENYNSVTGVGGDVRNSAGFYSWGGLLGFIPLIEEGYWK